MLVVGARFSVRRKFSGRNGQPVRHSASDEGGNSTQVLCLPFVSSTVRVPRAGCLLTPPVRHDVSGESCSTFPATPTCISPLIYEVFWHYLRLIFSPLFNTKIQKLNTYEQLQYNLSHSLHCDRHRP